MKSLSLYADKSSLIHRMDPVTKLFYVLAAMVIPLVLTDLIVGLICAAVNLLLLAIGKVLKSTFVVLSVLLFVFATVLLIQGFANVNNTIVAFHIFGIPFYQEGLLFGTKIVVRMINLVSAFLVLVLTTRPSDLVEDLVRAGFSAKIGYVINSIFQIVPQMISTADTIMDAQRSRGMETQGNLFVRMKAFVPLLGPVTLASLMNTKERAMALEVRAFASEHKKTFLNSSQIPSISKVIRLIFVLLIILAIAWRIGGRFL